MTMHWQAAPLSRKEALRRRSGSDVKGLRLSVRTDTPQPLPASGKTMHHHCQALRAHPPDLA
eukprot:3416119-Rhodomonas_salina.1